MGLTERLNEEGQRQTHQLSLDCFQKSGFEDDLNEFIKDHESDGIEKSIDGLKFEAWRSESGGWDCKVHALLRWGKKEDGSKAHRIEIVFEPDKKIRIFAGIWGSSILLPQTWQRSPETKRQALNRAYAHPGMPPLPIPPQPQGSEAKNCRDF